MQKRIFILILAGFILSQAKSQELFFEDNDSTISLYSDDQAIFTYQKITKGLNGKYLRSNYVHPLYGLDGNEITEDFPSDHLHHRGIFWTWHQLYQGDERIADPWLCENVSWQVDSVRTLIKDNSATLHAIVYWVVSGDHTGQAVHEKVLRENVSITFTQPDSSYYMLDFDINLSPLVNDLTLGGSEDDKEYGGFSVRLKATGKLGFFGDHGTIIPQITPVASDRGWVGVKANKESGVIIMCNPKNLPSFQGWILREEKSMQNPAFPGKEPISLRKGKPLHFKNRLIVYDSPLDNDQIDKQYQLFLYSYN